MELNLMSCNVKLFCDSMVTDATSTTGLQDIRPESQRVPACAVVQVHVLCVLVSCLAISPTKNSSSVALVCP